MNTDSRGGSLFLFGLLECLTIIPALRAGSKAAEDSRTPKRWRAVLCAGTREASWSAAVLCRFGPRAEGFRGRIGGVWKPPHLCPSVSLCGCVEFPRLTCSNPNHSRRRRSGNWPPFLRRRGLTGRERPSRTHPRTCRPIGENRTCPSTSWLPLPTDSRLDFSPALASPHSSPTVVLPPSTRSQKINAGGKRMERFPSGRMFVLAQEALPGIPETSICPPWATPGAGP